MQLKQLLYNGQLQQQQMQQQQQQRQEQENEQQSEIKEILEEQQVKQERQPFNLDILLMGQQTNNCEELMSTLHLFQHKDDKKEQKEEPKQQQQLKLSVVENKIQSSNYLNQFTPFYDEAIVEPNDYIINKLKRSVLNTTYYEQQEQIVTLANKTLRSQQFFNKVKIAIGCQNIDDIYKYLFQMNGEQALQLIIDFATEIFQKHQLLQSLPQKQPGSFIQFKINSSSALLQLFVTLLLIKLQGGALSQDFQRKFVIYNDLK